MKNDSSEFSTVLSFAEGRRSFNQLSLPRFVLWGDQEDSSRLD